MKKLFPFFVTGMTASLALFVGSNFLQRGGWLVVGALFVMGSTLMLCPFVTPQTVELLGLKRGLAVGRVLAMLLLAATVGLGFAMVAR